MEVAARKSSSERSRPGGREESIRETTAEKNTRKTHFMAIKQGAPVASHAGNT